MSTKAPESANLDSLSCPKGPNNPAQHRFEHDFRFPSRDLGNSRHFLDKFDLSHMMIGQRPKSALFIDEVQLPPVRGGTLDLVPQNCP